MKNRTRAKWVIGLLLAWLISPVYGEDLFTALVKESGMQWRFPAGFVEVTPVDNPYLTYEKGIKSADGKLEIRYALRPINRVIIDYDDPHGATPDPNHIFSRLFQSLTGNLSIGGNTPTREYMPEDARKVFGADWAAMSIFDVDPEYSKNYPAAMLLAMHKNRTADAFIIFLFKDYEEARTHIKNHLTHLIFQMDKTK